MSRDRLIRSIARADILRQFRYLIEQGAPGPATRFLEAVEQAIDQVMAMPGIGSPQPFAHPRLGNIRAWPVPGFEDIRIYYQELERGIRVVRVLHSRRDVKRIFTKE